MSVLSQLNPNMFEAKIAAVLHLTRWREHVPFTIPLTLVGALLAVQTSSATLDLRLLAVVVANILAMSFAFMINDVEDAPDDALNPRKKARNPVSNGTLTQREGFLISYMTALLAFALYAVSGMWVMVLGGLTLLLCYFYSAKPVRLKARPVTDVVSHALMLSGLLVMTGYFIYHANPGVAWYVIGAAILFSAAGQFYNQIDDAEVDKAAGLKNTVVLLGKRGTIILMNLCQGLAIVLMGLAIVNGAFPAWLGAGVVVGLLIVLQFKWDTDMRGNPVEDVNGMVQKPALIIANLVSLLWLASMLGLLSGAA